MPWQPPQQPWQLSWPWRYLPKKWCRLPPWQSPEQPVQAEQVVQPEHPPQYPEQPPQVTT